LNILATHWFYGILRRRSGPGGGPASILRKVDHYSSRGSVRADLDEQDKKRTPPLTRRRPPRVPLVCTRLLVRSTNFIGVPDSNFAAPEIRRMRFLAPKVSADFFVGA
jgi:hypothetical protein